MVLTAGLREQDAECAKYAANSAKAANAEGGLPAAMAARHLDVKVRGK
jgi:hypothetical protein